MKAFVCLVFFLLFSSLVLAAEKPPTTTITTTTTIEATDKEKLKDIYKKVETSDLKMEFLGTEYVAGEPAIIWLQLLRNYQPINNAACYATSYFPNKTMFLNRTLMDFLSGSDGLYYYDLTAPSTAGVYMLSAECVIPQDAFSDDFLDYSKLESWENITIFDDKIILSPYAGAFSAFDSSGNGRHGTLANMEISDWVAGKLNGALKFDGVNEYVDLEGIANFDKEQSFSVESWIKTTSNKTQNIISRRDAQPNIERGWEFQTKNGKLKFTVSRSITNTYWVSQESLQSINDGNFHHVIATWTGVTGTWGYPSNIKLYIDGQLADSYPSGNVVGWSIMNDAHCQISGKVFDTYNVFDGVIDEVVVYTKVLSLSEVQFRYNNGTGTENMMIDVFPYGWWHLNPLIGVTEGYIRSSPIVLDGINWHSFSSDYALNDGSISFKILDSANNPICSSLGDISACAGSTSPIKIYAELTKPFSNSTSPEIDRWWVTWSVATIEEIRGAGEIHISSASSVIAEKVWTEFFIKGTPPLMPSTNYYCLGSSLMKNITFDFCEAGVCKEYSKAEPQFCAYGCDVEMNACREAPYMIALKIFGGVVIFLLLLFGFLKWAGKV
jgi:hypothetical protein